MKDHINKLREKILKERDSNDIVKYQMPYKKHRDKILGNIKNGIMSFDLPYDDPSMKEMIFTINMIYGTKTEDGNYIDGIMLKQDYHRKLNMHLIINRTFLIYYLRKYYIIDEKKMTETKTVHLDIKEISNEDAKKCIEENPGLDVEGNKVG
jgi:hypothetical protein